MLAKALLMLYNNRAFGQKYMAVKWKVVDTLRSVVIQRIEFFHGASPYQE